MAGETPTQAGLPALTLILGGARSGKSRRGEALVARAPAPWLYIATGEARDAEMARRIAAHRARRGPGWTLCEAPLALAAALRGARGQANGILVDCLTLWLSNLMLAERDLTEEFDRLEAALAETPVPVVLVASEVGLGIVPETNLGRRFRDEAGILHQRLAARAQSVLLMVAGLPLVVK